MQNPYNVVRDFEAALCEYTGAPYAVTVTSCTMALLLACKRAMRDNQYLKTFHVPKRTYVGVPMSVMHAGGAVKFVDREWQGAYQLAPSPVYDSARSFSSCMYAAYPKGSLVCCSFHASKILGDTQGGCILTDNKRAAEWLKRMRFDGRTQGVPAEHDEVQDIGYHCYMSPDVAARLLLKLHSLPKYNTFLPVDPYPDLSLLPCFQE